MKQVSRERVLPRGRIAGWSAEQLEKLTTPELRALLENARRLNEPEIVEMCTQILDKRPRGHARAPQRRAEKRKPTVVE